MATAGRLRRIGVLGIILESNAFAPLVTGADFRRLCYLEGDAISDEAGKSTSPIPVEAKGFYAALTARGPWRPVPILLTAAESGGPADHAFFEETIETMRRRLEAALPVDGVYIINHGGMITSADRDPDGRLYAMVRDVVGPGVPVVATVDLHANVSEQMIASVDVFISYRTNPHVDQRERGAEAADALAELLDGLKPASAFIRLPIVAPTITLLTKEGPYADLIRYGQWMKMDDILNVSVVGGDPFTDTEKNGLAVVVTARRSRDAARALALDIARRAWDDRNRFIRKLMPMGEAVALAVKTGKDAGLPSIILADVADNPGGGGTGNTTELLAALTRAGAMGVLLGVFFDAALAEEAHRAGLGAHFPAVFNRIPRHDFAPRFEASALVTGLSDGRCVGTRGLWAGRALDLGPTAALDLGGVTVVVASVRKQCADPVFFSMVGQDVGAARTVVVKSRGHFRAGFEHVIPSERTYEVDGPGLTTPVLARLPFRHLPRPVFPMDAEADWRPPAWESA